MVISVFFLLFFPLPASLSILEVPTLRQVACSELQSYDM